MCRDREFSIVINSSSVGYVRSTKGFQKDNSILTDLFLLKTKEFVGFSKKAEVEGSIVDHYVCINACALSHLLFANDSIFFLQGLTRPSLGCQGYSS